MTLDEVSRVTKIQVRILERLEAANLEGLPAEVFVRGFVRSYAKCVGLDEDEALRRFIQCGVARLAQGSGTIAARAMVDAMRPITGDEPMPASIPMFEAPEAIASAATTPHETERRSSDDSLMLLPITGTLTPVAVRRIVVEQIQPIAEPVETAPAAPAETRSDGTTTTRKKKKKHGGKGRRAREKLAVGTPAQASPFVTVEEIPASAEPMPIAEEPIPPAIELAEPVEPVLDPAEEPIATEIWHPQFPKLPPPTSVPWRRPATVTSTAVVPSLVIDDADPDHAESVLEERAAAKSVLTIAQRRAFLPPVLLDREERSARGLTLAVIILVIAATLTLSYLMRRPSSSGDGVTAIDPAGPGPASSWPLQHLDDVG